MNRFLGFGLSDEGAAAEHMREHDRCFRVWDILIVVALLAPFWFLYDGPFNQPSQSIGWNLPFSNARSVSLIERQSAVADAEIVSYAAAINAVPLSQKERARLVEAVTQIRIQYVSDELVWGWHDYVPTIGEMRSLAAEKGWRNLREDCDGQAVYSLALARAVGLTAWPVVESYHAFILVSTDDGIFALNAVEPGHAEALEPGWRDIVTSAKRRELARFLGLITPEGEPANPPPPIDGINWLARWKCCGLAMIYGWPVLFFMPPTRRRILQRLRAGRDFLAGKLRPSLGHDRSTRA